VELVATLNGTRVNAQWLAANGQSEKETVCSRTHKWVPRSANSALGFAECPLKGGSLPRPGRRLDSTVGPRPMRGKSMASQTSP